MNQDEQQRRLDELNGEGLKVADDATALDFLCAVYRNAAQPMARRMKAASEAAQYMHPTFKATAMVVANDSFAARLEAAIARSGAAPKLIESGARNRRRTCWAPAIRPITNSDGCAVRKFQATRINALQSAQIVSEDEPILRLVIGGTSVDYALRRSLLLLLAKQAIEAYIWSDHLEGEWKGDGVIGARQE
jgi:hypothetical protein